jgi:DNA modification methylase
VLDPFLGSGTTLAVAAKLGRSGIGIELNPAYVALAEKRIGLAKNPHTWRDTSRADAASLFHQEPA